MTIDEQVSTWFIHTKQGDLPSGVLNYCKFLSNKYGYCGEVMLTAMYHYLQAVENMEPPQDEGYHLDEQGKEWFANNGPLDTLRQRYCEQPSSSQ